MLSLKIITVGDPANPVFSAPVMATREGTAK